jgi:membrane-associated phospholipid phosphatase
MAKQRPQMGNRQTERLAEFGGIVVAGFAAAVVLLYGFALLANEVLERETTAMDAAAAAFLQQFSSPQLTAAAQIISVMGSQAVLVLGAVLLGILVWQGRWGAALTLVLVTAGAQILNDILKELFHRTRPAPVSGFLDAQQFSFPSGHAMVAAAFYFYVAYLAWRLVHGWWRGLVVVALVALVLLIGVARIYLQAHYLSDVIAGYLAGFLWADAVMLGSRVLTFRKHKPPGPRERAAHGRATPRTLNG